jgi:hypothetical protein
LHPSVQQSLLCVKDVQGRALADLGFVANAGERNFGRADLRLGRFDYARRCLVGVPGAGNLRARHVAQQINLQFPLTKRFLGLARFRKCPQWALGLTKPLQSIRILQEELVTMADQRSSHAVGVKSGETAPTIDQFLAGLRTAWKSGNVRPTSRPKPTLKRERRRPDPLVDVTETLRAWFAAEPNRTARQLLQRLQNDQPGAYPDELLRTVQRRVKIWRQEAASQLVVGWMQSTLATAPA